MRYRLRAETEAQKHGADLDRSMLERALEAELSHEREELDHAHIELARVQAAHAARATVGEVMARKDLRDLQQSLQVEQVRGVWSSARTLC